jgi:hypothetical protein
MTSVKPQVVAIPRDVGSFLVSSNKRHVAAVFSFDPRTLEVKYNTSIFKIDKVENSIKSRRTDKKTAGSSTGSAAVTAASVEIKESKQHSGNSKNRSASAASTASATSTSTGTKSSNKKESAVTGAGLGLSKGSKSDKTNGSLNKGAKKGISRKEKRLHKVEAFGKIQESQIFDTAAKRYLADPQSFTVCDKKTWRTVRQTFRQYLKANAPKIAAHESRLNDAVDAFMTNLVQNCISRERVPTAPKDTIEHAADE